MGSTDRPTAPALAVSTLIGPGERDLVERLRAEPLRGPLDHPPAERAIEIRRRLVVGQRPDHHALQTALPEIAPRRGEQPAAEAEALKLGSQVKLVDLAVEVEA